MKDSEKTYVDYYRTRRSLDYIDQYEPEQSWRKISGGLRRRRMRERMVYSSSVAALLAVSFAAFYFTGKFTPENQFADNKGHVEQTGRTGVTLSFADGSTVDLTACDEQGLDERGIVHDQKNNRLIYVAKEGDKALSVTNRLEVPRGAEYHLILSDGTKVWVNANSRLVYPETFGKVREVELSGEAYFEVTHDETRPFVVHTEGMAVRVLGTEFNVNTHPARGVQAVLVKGKVEVDAGGKQKAVLAPGELAETVSGQMRVAKVNVRKYTAWRYGEFYFDNASLEEIMQELEAWYDVKPVFINQALRHRKFSGVLKRSETIGDILRKIEHTTSVHFSLKDQMIQIE